MSEAIDRMFAAIVDETPRGAHRMVVLENPTEAQLRALPIGSDVVFTDDERFMNGPWTAVILERMVDTINAGPCPHLHAYIAYVPPVPTPDSTLTAEAIAAAIIEDTHAEPNEEGDVTMQARTLRFLLERAVHTAREGMVYPPF